LFPPDDERLSLETCRGRKINTLKKVKKVRQVGCKSRVICYVECFLLHFYYPQFVYGAQYGCFLYFLNFVLSWYVAQVLSDFEMVPVAPIITGILLVLLINLYDNVSL
jgi:hypothetical protein